MRQIGSLENEPDARRFAAYLLTQGVKNSVEEAGPVDAGTGLTAGNGSWAVWIEEDDHLDRGRSELDAFRRHPADPRYDAAVTHAEKLRRTETKQEQRRRKQFVDVRTRWGQPSQLARPVTVALVALTLLAAMLTFAGMKETPATNVLRIEPVTWLEDGRSFQFNGLSHVRSGEVWRLLTPIFLHFGPIHLIFNMFWLLDLGSMIETRRGSRFLLAFVLITAVVSNVAQYGMPALIPELLGRAHPNFGGMSGVVYALFGYVWIKGRFQPHLGLGVSQETALIMLAWLVICMIPGILPVNIANTAHVVGLLCGLAVAYVPIAAKRLRPRGR